MLFPIVSASRPKNALLSCVLAFAAACSGKVSDDTNGLGHGGTGAFGATAGQPGSGASAATGADSTGGGTTGSGATGGTGIVIDPGVTAGGNDDGGPVGAGGEGGSDGNPEVCDGIDNDGNGIIDDVDVGHDGVCDCLNIGTVGAIGPWSDGGDIFVDWLNARSPRPAVMLADDEITEKNLAPLQVVVFLHVATTDVVANTRSVPAHHQFSDAEVSAFGKWVKKGGGAMSTIGYSPDEASEVVNVNRMLGAVNMGYSTSKLDVGGYVTDWVTHPVTDGVKKIFTDNGVEPDGTDGTTLAHDESGHVALQVAEPGDGHVVVWGDEWITYDSEWVDVKDQQVELFWLNILKYLSPAKTCQVPIPPSVVR